MARFTITGNNLTNCSIYNTGVSDTGRTFSIYFFPDNGYSFNEPPYILVTYEDYMGDTLTEKVLATEKSGTFTNKKYTYIIERFSWNSYETRKDLGWNNTDITGVVYANATDGSVNPEPLPPEPKNEPKIIYNTDSLTGCNMTKNPDNDTVSVNHTFTLNAFSGYVFTLPIPELSVFYNDSYGIEQEIKKEFSKVSDTEYTLDYTFDGSDWNNGNVTFIFNAVAIVNTQTKQAYGTAQLYLLSDDNLIEFAKSRDFVTENNDIGQYVISLNKVFCSIPDTELTDTTLKLGAKDTKINCKAINSISMRLDCGSVLVPNITNIDCNIQLFLPFSGVQDLTNYKQELSGKTVKLYYDIVIANGQTIATVECDNLSLYYELSISYEIPYFLNTFNNADISTTYSINAKFLSGKVPYIYIMTNKPQNFNIGGVRDTDITEIKQLIKEGVIL